MGTQDLVTLVPWTFIAQICNLFIQLWLIKKFLFKPINEVIEKRRQLTEQEIKGAREAKAKAEEMKKEYETSLSSAQSEAAEIVAKAQKEAQGKADNIVKDAEQQAKGLIERAEADIEQSKKKAINEAKDTIGGLAMDIAGKVVEKEINENDHKKLIDEFINNVGEAS
ncbi:F0F1 ATP synthase subunit B [Butyrivibrio sp. VCD2006]|uniref:F0F1 ATP synthase subunit B n=1 Tax=Butyrivibrio sp. VCD2006 TaxID=1280664 RepID=UPI00040202EA|nr:F0F1 ATP synthase subunit B [Butyrivibrio sp. VCD2006]